MRRKKTSRKTNVTQTRLAGREKHTLVHTSLLIDRKMQHDCYNIIADYLINGVTTDRFTKADITSYHLMLIKMRAELASLSDCAVPF